MNSIHRELQGRELHVLQVLGIHPQDRHQHCPFPDHSDRHPSWRWDAGKARWFCSCGSGSVVDAAQRLHGGSVGEAIRLVRGLLGGEAAPSVRASMGMERETAAIRRQRAEAAAVLAAALWNGALPANPDHPYLRAKSVRPHDLREQGSELLVPLYDIAGRLWNLQTIGPDGRKLFLRGGRVRGCFSPVGLTEPPSRLILCEGWATGATLREETAWPALAAMNAGNLKAVALAAREAWPEADIVVGADNDRQTKGNPGVRFATEAARAIGGRLAVPEFPEGAPGSDFNDVSQSCSKNGVTGVTRVTAGEVSRNSKELATHEFVTPCPAGGVTRVTNPARLEAVR